MKSLLVATRNRGKIAEISSLLGGLVEQVFSFADFDDFPETVEDGLTFEENALKKAREAMRFSGFPSLADDSGLVVDSLDGRPGVFSARFAGEAANDASNNALLLVEMNSVPAEKRQAAFICVLAYVTPEGVEKLFTGRVSGKIISKARGEGGFGYDPLFQVDGFGRSMAELSLAEKNAVSHRATAFRKFREYLEGAEHFEK